MRSGLRLQILLLLGGLLLLAFFPLFFAIATYTRFTIGELGTRHAKALGTVIAAELAEDRAHHSSEDLTRELASRVGQYGIHAIAIYDTEGKATNRAGDRDALDSLPRHISPTTPTYARVSTPRGEAWRVTLASANGVVAVVVRADDEGARVEPLVQLLGLYIGVMALALLVLAYFALTRLIVRPLDAMSRAAERVAGGTRHWDLPGRGPRELAELGASLKTMTEKLLGEERALRKKIDEVEEATKNLREAQQRLIRSERLASVGRLAAGLAHEVGNPIAALIGMQDLLLEGGLSEAEQRDFLQRMRKETERVNAILRDLLQFARPASARGPKDATEPGDVEAAVFDTVTLVSPQKSMQDIELQVDVYPELPKVALAGEQLVQVLLNLLLNAADACEGKGKIKIVAEASDDTVILFVEDTGPGVTDAVANQLFEPFVTTKEVGKGTGLGLAVCRGLVEAVGGSIALDPSYDAGARFVVRLPAAKA